MKRAVSEPSCGPPAPCRLLLQWHVTERCNLRCGHCYQEGTPAPERPLAELLQILRQYEEFLDAVPVRRCGHVTVTGGEPFLRPDFFSLLEALSARKSRFGFAILTNGSLIDREVARRLRRLAPRFVQVSIDGNEATHDGIRGNGDFGRVVSAVRHLVREKIRVLISFTAHRRNFREFPQVAELGRKLGASRVWADRLIPAGRGAGFETLTPQETLDLFRLMRRARDDARRRWFNRTEVAMHRALQFLEGGRPYRCAAGDTLLAVQPNGDVLPCRRMPVCVGNLFETPLAVLYRDSPLLQSLRDRKRVSRGCETCRFASACGGGLRCLACAVTGDPFRADPGCWLAVRPSPAAKCLRGDLL